MIGELAPGALQRRAAAEFLRFDSITIGGKDELDLVAGCGRTLAEGGQRLADLPLRSHGEVDVAPLEDATHLRFVGVAGAELSKRRLLVTKCLEKGVRELRRIDRLGEEI